MFYFVSDESGKLISTFNVVLSPHATYYCPFCQMPMVRKISPSSSTIYYEHIVDVSYCSPSLTDQINFYLKSSLPCNLKIAFPKLEHTVQSMTLHYPDFPNKTFTFPQENFVFSETIINFQSNELTCLDYPSNSIFAYHATKDEKCYVLVFNLYGSSFEKDLIDEVIFYNSTVIQFDAPDGFSANDFRFGITVDKVIDMCRATYIRSEILLHQIQQAYLETKKKHLLFVEKQSANLLELLNAGVIRFRR